MSVMSFTERLYIKVLYFFGEFMTKEIEDEDTRACLKGLIAIVAPPEKSHVNPYVTTLINMMFHGDVDQKQYEGCIRMMRHYQLMPPLLDCDDGIDDSDTCIYDVLSEWSNQKADAEIAKTTQIIAGIVGTYFPEYSASQSQVCSTTCSNYKPKSEEIIKIIGIIRVEIGISNQNESFIGKGIKRVQFCDRRSVDVFGEAEGQSTVIV